MGDFTKVHVLQVVEGKLKSSSPLVRFDSDLYFSVTLLASSSLAQLLVVLKRRANIVVKKGDTCHFRVGARKTLCTSFFKKYFFLLHNYKLGIESLCFHSCVVFRAPTLK